MARRCGAVALAICLAVVVPAMSQMSWPLQGQYIPPDGVTAVTVDVVLDALRAINSHSNSWNGVHWIHLSWTDPRTAPAIQSSTAAWQAANYTPGGCNKPCDSSHQPTAGCCDNVWLPHLVGNNLVSLSQEADYRWFIWVEPDATTGAAGSTVHLAARITAEWVSPFDFRAWPFEHQHLLVELQVIPSLADRVYLVMGQAGISANTPTAKGDPVPGWYTARITRRIFDDSACFNSTNATSVYTLTQTSPLISFKPLQPWYWQQLQSSQPSDTELSSIDLADCNPSFNAAAVAQYGPQMIVVDIMMRRTATYYVLANILPLLLLDYMVFITYAMDRSNLEARMGVVVTLVLAISALQFTFDFPPASYLNAVQQITLMSYLLYFIVAIEAMISTRIHRLHANKRKYEQIKLSAAKRGQMSFGDMQSYGSLQVGTDAVKQAFASQAGDGDKPSTSTQIELATRNSSHTAITVPHVAAPTWGGALRMRATGQSPKSSGKTPQPVDWSSAYASSQTNMLQGIDQSAAGRSGPVAEGSDPMVQGLVDEAADRPRQQTGPPRKAFTSGWKASFSSKTLKRTYSKAANHVAKLHNTARNLDKRIDADEAFAQLVARRLDQIFCFTLVICFTITWAVLLYVNTAVGDHRLMLHGKPGNM